MIVQTLSTTVYPRSPRRGLLKVHVQASLVGADEDLQPQLQVVGISLRDTKREDEEERLASGALLTQTNVLKIHIVPAIDSTYSAL